MADMQLKSLLERPDPMLNHLWDSPDTVLPFGLPSNYVESIDLPLENIQVSEGVHGGASYEYFPGTSDVTGFTMTLYEDANSTTLKWIMRWKEAIKDLRTGLYKLPDNYKKDLTFRLLNIKGSPIFTVKLLGCWPEATSSLSLNYTDNGRVIISQAFSVDAQEITFHK